MGSATRAVVRDVEGGGHARRAGPPPRSLPRCPAAIRWAWSRCMTHDLVRTTSIRLRPEHFGRVYVYRAGERFLGAWRRLEDACRATDYRHLPYKGLETAWRVLSGDFVRVWVNRREPTVLVSRCRLGLDVLQSGLLAWEYAIWPETARGILAEVADDLTC